MSENEFNMDNIVNISIDGKALSRELIRGMSDEELDLFLEGLINRARMQGFMDAMAMMMGGIPEMNDEEEEEE